ncbi:MAG: hypothetical protein NTW87_00055 [Planctomycetota bacterium]|nr:hypothetical protein [Planctomycetota bacterium]
MATEPVPKKGSDAPTLVPGPAQAGDGKAGAEETIGLPGNEQRPKVPAIAIPPVRERTQTVGPYTLLRLLGRGGMGAVLKAVDRDIRRPVAMKIMLGEADERKRARFVRAASFMESGLPCDTRGHCSLVLCSAERPWPPRRSSPTRAS